VLYKLDLAEGLFHQILNNTKLVKNTNGVEIHFSPLCPTEHRHTFWYRNLLSTSNLRFGNSTSAQGSGFGGGNEATLADLSFSFNKALLLKFNKIYRYQ
jgi:hypothetical protein